MKNGDTNAICHKKLGIDDLFDGTIIQMIYEKYYTNFVEYIEFLDEEGEILWNKVNLTDIIKATRNSSKLYIRHVFIDNLCYIIKKSTSVKLLQNEKEEDVKIFGYAYAHRYMERAAYQWNVELSIYLDKFHVSKGFGKKLCLVLIEILKAQGVKTVYSLITSPNIKSEKLHLSLGFKAVGMYHRTGFKNGCWHDVAIFEKKIGKNDNNPTPIISIKKIESYIIEKIINE